MRDMNPRYFLRNQDIPLVYTRTETFRRSFFPSVIRAWNSLDPQIRSSDTLSLFKMKLKEIKSRKICIIPWVVD